MRSRTGAPRWLLGCALAAAALISCRKAERSEREGPRPAAPAGGAAAAPRATRLGTLAFEVTGGTPAAREHFERGLLALHSFWYDEAGAQFQAAVDADPGFAMAYWG